MQKKYEFLFVVYCYSNREDCIKLLHSLDRFSSQNLIVCVSNKPETVQFFKDTKSTWDKHNDVVIFEGSLDQTIIGKNWPFLWARAEGIPYDYYVYLDDDLWWTLPFVDKAKYYLEKYQEIGIFSLGSRTKYEYRQCGYLGDIEGADNLPYLNGDNMFCRRTDLEVVGLYDDNPMHPISYFTEIDLAVRFRKLLGKCSVRDFSHPYCEHTYALGRHNKGDTTNNQRARWGEEFYKAKYGFWGGNHHWFDKLENIEGLSVDQVRNMMLYGQRDNLNFESMYAFSKPLFTLVE